MSAVSLKKREGDQTVGEAVQADEYLTKGLDVRSRGRTLLSSGRLTIGAEGKAPITSRSPSFFL